MTPRRGGPLAGDQVNLVVAVEVDLVTFRSPSCVPCFSSSTMLGLPAAAATDVGNQSGSPEMSPFSTFAGRHLARPANDGWRAETTFQNLPLAPREGRSLAAIGPGEVLRAVVGGEDEGMVSCSRPSSLSFFMTAPTMVVELGHSGFVDGPAVTPEASSLSYFSERWVTMCMRVRISQRGRVACRQPLALSRNSNVQNRGSRRPLSHATPVAGPGRPECVLLARACPSGCSVGSSTSVAQVCSMFRGPTLSFSSGGSSWDGRILHREADKMSGTNGTRFSLSNYPKTPVVLM